MKPRYTDAFWGEHPFDGYMILIKNKNENKNKNKEAATADSKTLHSIHRRKGSVNPLNKVKSLPKANKGPSQAIEDSSHAICSQDQANRSERSVQSDDSFNSSLKANTSEDADGHVTTPHDSASSNSKANLYGEDAKTNGNLDAPSNQIGDES